MEILRRMAEYSRGEKEDASPLKRNRDFKACGSESPNLFRGTGQNPEALKNTFLLNVAPLKWPHFCLELSLTHVAKILDFFAIALQGKADLICYYVVSAVSSELFVVSLAVLSRSIFLQHIKF